jgi:outer membrane lipoprotein-sorting protein
MSYLRRISTRRLLAICAGVVIAGIATAALALAATSGGPTPPPKSLPAAIRGALTAPSVPGVSARIQFTNHLLSSGSLQGSDPLLTGGSGRLWATSNGKVRIELQSDSARGDSEIVVDGRRFLIYSGDSGTAYRGRLPRKRGGSPDAHRDAHAPLLTQIRRELASVSRYLAVGKSNPTDVAGRPAYGVSVSPKSHGGLVGAVHLAWDAVHGTPLDAAVYARGSSSPVLELRATDISFGPVSDSVFAISPAPGTKITNLGTVHGHPASRAAAPLKGFAAVRRNLDFPLAAPTSLAGMSRGQVHLVRGDQSNIALITYGRGLDGLVVLEQPFSGAQRGPGAGGELSLPTVSVGGVSGQELQTALGTVIRFQQRGVAYTLAGSVRSAVAEEAARGLLR